MTFQILVLLAALDLPGRSVSVAPDWIDTVASTSRDVASAVAATADGGVVTLGRYSTHLSASEPTHRLFNRGHYDLYLLRHDADGRRAWMRRIGGPGNESAGALRTLGDGRVCLTGAFEGRAGGVRDGLPELRSHGATDGLLACYDAAGEALWAHRIGGKGPDALTALAELPGGELLVGGEIATMAGVPLAGGRPTLLRGHGARSALLARVDAAGSFASAVLFSASGAASVRALATGADGQAVALLRFRGVLSLALDDGRHRQLRSGVHSDLAVIALNRELGVRWVATLGGPGSEAGAAIAVDGTGRVAVVGSFTDAIHGAAAERRSAGSSDVFLAEFSATGDALALHRIGAEQAEVGWAVAPDGDDWIVALSFIDHTQIGESPVSATATSAALVGVDPFGRASLRRLIAGDGLEQVVSLARVGPGRYAVAGAFNGDLRVGYGAPVQRPLRKLDAFTATLHLDPPAPARARNARATRRSAAVPYW